MARTTRRGRGEGGLEELPSGSWRAVASLGIDPKTKKRVRESRTFPTKREATDWRNDTIRKHAAGELNHTASTVDEWLTTWLSIRKTTKAANTYRTESDTAERIVRPSSKRDDKPGIGDLKLKDLTPLALERWLARLAEDKVTVNQRRKAAHLLRVMFNDAIKRRVMASNPMKGVTIPRAEHTEAVALDAAQLAAFIAAADSAGRGALFRLWADAGLRPGELYGLQWGDFDPAALSLTVRRSVCSTTGKLKAPKTKRGRRTILLCPSTVTALQSIRPAGALADAPMFPTPRDGKYWRNDNFAAMVFRPLAAKAGLTGIAYPYLLRHTSASHLLQRGVSLKAVSRRLGHEDEITTLRTYAHLLPGDQEKAALAMEEILNPKRSPHAVPTDG